MILRLTGNLLALAGIVVFVGDGALSIAASEVTLTSFGAAWHSLSPHGMSVARAALEAHAPFIWDPVVATVLEAPVFAVALAAGLAIAALNSTIDASLARLDWRVLAGRGA